MGFWTNLFEVHHYKLLSGKPIKIFNNLPSGYGRKEVLFDLNKIRRLRNRINHNEPICFDGATIDFAPIENIYASLINILKWMDPKLENRISDIDTFKTKIKNAKKIKF